MAGTLVLLRTALRAADQYVNDHDFICKCRPVDVRLALSTIEKLEAEVDRLRDNLPKTAAEAKEGE